MVFGWLWMVKERYWMDVWWILNGCWMDSDAFWMVIVGFWNDCDEFLECDWIVGPRRFSPAICIYIYRHICIHIYIYIACTPGWSASHFPLYLGCRFASAFFGYIYIYLYVSYFSGSSACYPFWIDFGSFRMDSVVCWGEEAIFWGNIDMDVPYVYIYIYTHTCEYICIYLYM